MVNETIDEKLESKRVEMENLIEKNRNLLLRDYILIIVNWCVAFIFLWLYFNPIDPVFKLLWGGFSGITIFVVTGMMMTTIKSYKIAKNAEVILTNYLNNS